MKFITPFLLLAFFLFAQSLNAQNASIGFENPERINICESKIFKFSVQSNQTALNNTEMRLQIGGALKYVSGTVSGAAELNISDPENPVFSIGNLSPGQKIDISLELFADCEALATLNAGQIFTNRVEVTYAGGSDVIVTAPLRVETPFLVITRVEGSLLRGSRGTVLERRITIKNTRQGSVFGFTFKDVFQPGISISSPQGADQSANPQIFELDINSSHFRSIGNRNDLFDFNESIVIVEQITIDDCGDNFKFSLSDIEVGWGCSGEICQQNSTSAYVEILPGELAPDLSFEPQANLPATCFCGPEGMATQSILIKNNGDADALAVNLTIRQDSLPGVVLIPGSFQITKNGVTSSLVGVNFLSPVTFMPECAAAGNYFSIAIAQIPVIAPGESILISWDVQFCRTDCKNQNQQFWRLETSYNFPCKVKGVDKRTESFFVEAEGSDDQAGIAFLNSNTINTVNENNFIFNLENSHLLNQNGILHLTFHHRRSLDVRTDFILGGRAPDQRDSSFVGNEIYFYLQYNLPFDSSRATMPFSVFYNCSDFSPITFFHFESSCEVDTCSVTDRKDPPPLNIVSFTGRFDLGGDCDSLCQPSFCIDQTIGNSCPPDDFEVDTIVGYIDFNFVSYRENLGLADNNNDRRADAGPIDLNRINRYRLLPGDTVFQQVKGVIRTDFPGTTFDHILISTQVNSLDDPALLEKNKPFYTSTYFKKIFEEFTVFDKSTNQYFTCNNLPVQISNLATGLNYYYKVEANYLIANCNFPAGFVFEEGDSILLTNRFQPFRNVSKINPADNGVPKLNFSINTIMTVPNSRNEDILKWCGCEAKSYELTGYEVKFGPGLYNVLPCETADYLGGSLFTVQLCQGNFFPFEVRPLGIWRDFSFGFTDRIKILDAKLGSLSLQGASLFLQNQPVVLNLTDTLYNLQIEHFQTDVILDEGFLMLIQFSFDADCDLSGFFNTHFSSRFSFNEQLPETENPKIFTQNSRSIGTLTPQLSASALLPNISSDERRVRWEFNLRNRAVTGGSISSGPSLNTWIEAISPTGNVRNFQLFDTETGQFISQINNIFQIGNYPENANHRFVLLGESFSCTEEPVVLRYGWNCTPYDDNLKVSCFENTLDLSVQVLPGELETILDTTKISGDLCSPLPPIVIDVYNADLGSLFAPHLEATLPRGTTILPGSSQVIHGVNPVFQAVDDPILVGGNTYRWEFEKLVDSIEQRGLTSFLKEPFNSVKLSFQVEAQCNFIAESSPIFIASGSQNCGVPTNQRTRVGSKISINGISAPYATNIQPLIANTIASCQDTTTLIYRITASDVTGENDSIFIYLPAGIFYVSGSFESLQNLSGTMPDLAGTPDQQILKIKMPEALAANDAMSFKFVVSGLSSAGCAPLNILVQTVVPDSALCVSTNEICGISVETGSFLFPLIISKNALTLSDLEIELSNTGGQDNLIFTVSVNNNGSNPSNPPATIRFYEDSNGNGQIDSGDRFLYQQVYNSSVGSGTSAVVSGNFPVGAIDFSKILAGILLDDNCVCQPSILPVGISIVRNFNDLIIVCSNQTADIGVPALSGASYQWNPPANLNCTNCPTAVFQFENKTPVPRTFYYTLTEKAASGFQIVNNLTVVVRPEPQILAQNAAICAGDCVNLSTTQAASVVWQGPDIQNTNLPVQTVCPQVSSMYSATITDSYGCSATDDVQVTVFPGPMIDAGADTIVCVGEFLRLKAEENSALNYSWQPASAVSNPNIARPLFTGQSPTLLLLTVTDANNCKITDSVFVNIRERADLQVSPGRVICFGSTIQLSASGAPDIQWNPTDLVDCDTCNVVTISPQQSTVFSVTGSFGGLCRDTQFIEITVVEDSIFTEQSFTRCEGESIQIFGTIITRDTSLTRSFTTVNGCDSIHTITVTFRSAPLAELETINPVCPDGCDGSVIILPISEGLEYSLDNQPFTGDTIFQNLCPGDYSVRMRDSTGCTFLIQNVVLITPQEPGFQIIGDTTVFSGDTIQLGITVPPGVDISEIIWSPTELLSCSNCPNPFAFPVENPTTFTATITDQNGCVVTRQYSIRVAAFCDTAEIKIPNIFTPNGDGINDRFEIVTTKRNSVNIISFVIYNRWGELVYERYDNSASWDGTQRGKPAVSDVYIYIIKVGCPGYEKRYSDDVTLMR